MIPDDFLIVFYAYTFVKMQEIVQGDGPIVVRVMALAVSAMPLIAAIGLLAE